MRKRKKANKSGVKVFFIFAAIRRYVAKVIATVGKHKLSALFFVGVLPVLLLCYFYMFYVDIVVNDVVLPSELDGGVYSASITKSAASSVDQFVLDQIKEASVISDGYKLRNSDGSTECALINLPVGEEEDLSTLILKEIQVRSQIPDIEITSHKFSLLKVVSLLKKLLGFSYIEIDSSVIKEGKYYVLKVTATAQNGKQAIIKEPFLESVDQIERALTAGYARVVWPEFFAAKERPRAPSDVEFELFVAKNILNDRAKTAFILMMQMDSLEISRTKSDLLSDVLISRSIAEDLEKNYDLSSFGRFRNAALLNLISARAQYLKVDSMFSEKQRTNSERRKEAEALLKNKELVDKYHEIGAKELLMSEKHRNEFMLLRKKAESIYESSQKRIVDDMAYASVLLDLNNIVKPVHILKSSIEKNSNNPSYPHESVLSLKIAYMMVLLKLGRFSELEDFVALEKYKNSMFLSEYKGVFKALFEVFEAQLDIAKGNYKKMIVLIESGELNRFPCIEMGALESLQGDPANYSLINSAMGRMEGSGFRNFQFYNNWGALLVDMGRYQDSYAKYGASLKYSGDRAWAFLNWGRAALFAGDHDISVSKYKESLKEGLVYSAVYGLLMALSESNRSSEFVKQYERYYDYLKENLDRREDENNKVLFSKMVHAHKCRSGGDGKVDYLTSVSKLALDAFDNQKCSWLQH